MLQNSYIELGERLREIRVQFGFTQEQLANTLGIERSTYSYYESGKTRPDIFDLMRLAGLYGISLDALVNYTTPTHVLTDSAAKKAPVRRIHKNNTAPAMHLSKEEQQLLAYYRTATAAERAEVFEYLREKRKKTHKRNADT